MRILPHHQDTGGFFVAVLEKVKLLPWESNSNSDSQTVEKIEIQEVNTEAGIDEAPEVEDEKNDKKRALSVDKKPWGPQRKKKRLGGYREDPFVFFKNESEDVWSSIK